MQTTEKAASSFGSFWHPWEIENRQVTFSIGYPAEKVPVVRAGKTVTVDLPPNTMYLVLE